MLVGVVVVQVILAPRAFVTVHAITPPGVAPLAGPVTSAVNVIEPPRVGVPDSVRVTVGTT